MIIQRDDERSRRELRADLALARARTDELFALVSPDGLLERPIAERHRLIFYLGHLEAFEWNLLCRDALGHASLDATFERLFAFGIDPIDGDSPADRASDWPTAERIRSWSMATREAVDAALARAPFTGWLEDGWIARMAIEHRLMHAETLCYLLQRLELKHLRPGKPPSVAPAAATSMPIDIPAGTAILGLSRADAPHVGWDNEYERHAVVVPGFTMASLPVSNAQWLDFIDAGGYGDRSLWDAAAWEWREREGVTHPGSWRLRDGRWHSRAMLGETPLPAGSPVHVSHAEASAYARWKGARLMTEPEWHRALDSGASSLVGGGWEWTSTPFAPFAGFEPQPFYPGYSADFFDGRHFVLKGASDVTPAPLIRPSFRNWFQPHYQHVPAKFRLVTGERRIA